MAKILPTSQVPAELLGYGGGPNRSGSLPEPAPLDPVQGSGAVWDDASGNAQPHRGGQVGSLTKQKYGAWYVPPDDWGSVFKPGGPELHKEVHLALRAGVGCTSCFPAGPAAHLQGAVTARRNADREQQLQQALATSYAARAYKEHLKDHDLPEPSSLANLGVPSESDMAHDSRQARPESVAAVVLELQGAASPRVAHGRRSPRASPRNMAVTSMHARHVPTAPGQPSHALTAHAQPRTSVMGGVGGPRVSSMGGPPMRKLASPFQDMELDEIISPEMRAAVRKTLAMQQMLADHAANMKKYYTERHKTAALSSAIKSRGLEPLTPVGHSALTAEYLLALSPSQMQTIMTPATGARVGALVAAAHHLRTDGTLADADCLPDSPVPLLHLPTNLLSNRSVKFSEARAPNRPPAPDAATTARTQIGYDVDGGCDGQWDNEPEAKDLVWSDEDSNDGRSGKEQTSGDEHAESMQGQQVHQITAGRDADADGSIWDVPMLQLTGHAPVALPSPAPCAPDTETDMCDTCEAFLSAAELADNARFVRVPGRVPTIDIPMPAAGSFLSDRSLTTSDVLRHVPPSLIPPLPLHPTAHMQLPAQVHAQTKRQAAANYGALLAEYQDVAPSARIEQSPSHPQQEAVQQPQQHWPAAATGSITLQEKSRASSPEPDNAPLAIHVLGCLASKAKGLKHVAPIFPHRPVNNRSAPATRGASPPPAAGSRSQATPAVPTNPASPAPQTRTPKAAWPTSASPSGQQWDEANHWAVTSGAAATLQPVNAAEHLLPSNAQDARHGKDSKQVKTRARRDASPPAVGRNHNSCGSASPALACDSSRRATGHRSPALESNQYGHSAPVKAPHHSSPALDSGEGVAARAHHDSTGGGCAHGWRPGCARLTVSAGPHPNAMPSGIFGPMNLSLSYLAGDRVPRPGSKQSLPPEARGVCSAVSSPGGRRSTADWVVPGSRAHSSVAQRVSYDSVCAGSGGGWGSEWLRATGGGGRSHSPDLEAWGDHRRQAVIVKRQGTDASLPVEQAGRVSPANALPAVFKPRRVVHE